MRIDFVKRIDRAAREVEGLKPADLKVLWWMADIASSDDHHVWASNEYIADMAGVHVRTVQRALIPLAARNMIHQIRKSKRTLQANADVANKWKVNTPKYWRVPEITETPKTTPVDDSPSQANDQPSQANDSRHPTY